MPNIQNSTVVPSAYDTSGNGGRKLVRLSNGWLVSAVKKTGATPYQIIFEVSKDNGNTWSQLCYMDYNTTTFSDVSIISFGTKVYVISNTTSTNVYFASFDALTVLNTATLSGVITIDTSQTSVGNLSLTINPQGTELHACWSSKNATYSNTFNIRYAKGAINGDGSVTWGSVVQVSNYNVAYDGYKNPTIVLNSVGLPVILCDVGMNTGVSWIAYFYYNGSVWNTATPGAIDNLGYSQFSPSAVFIPKSINGLTNGRIYCTWSGLDTTDASKYNIRVSYSDDNGITWSAMQKLTTGNVYDQKFPTITYNNKNEIFILFSGCNGAVDAVRKMVRQLKYANSSWGAIQDITTPANTTETYPSSLVGFDNFSSPLFVYDRNQSGTLVGFYGTWSITIISDVDSSLGQVSSLIKTYTISNGEITTLSVVEKLDGVEIRNYTATVGNTNTIDLTSTWNTLSYTTHTLTVECDGLKRTWTFAKIFGSNSKASEMISALLDLTGINQKADLKTALTTKGLTIADSDGITDMIGKLSNATLKNFASGTVTSSSASVNFQNLNGTNEGTVYSATVTGLTFKPRVIYMTYSTASFVFITEYTDLGETLYAKPIKVAYFGKAVNASSTYQYKGDVAPASVTNGSFVLPCWTASVVYNWIAIE